MHLLELGIRPRQIMTKEAFENAIAVIDGARRLDQRGAAPARHRATRREVELELDDFNRVGARVAAHRRHEAARQVPHGRPRPRRRRAGRDAAAARRRAAARRLPHRHRQDDGREPRRRSTRPRPTARSCTRSTDADPRARAASRCSRGSLAPKGVGREGRRASTTSCASTAPPACSTARTAAMEAILAGTIKPGDVVVIRYEGPKGGPGHARDARGHRRDEGRRPRRATARSSPTAGSRAARTASASATSRPRRSTAGRSRSSPTATASSIDVHDHTIDLHGRRRRAGPPARGVEAARAALHDRRAGQVRRWSPAPSAAPSPRREPERSQGRLPSRRSASTAETADRRGST